MEKRTIGSFIAALRKANGLTQKDLAEKLNVSDKTISRWERDDGTPDLSLIPVIAEIFEVSCDELIRGERRPAEERQDSTLTPKGEKQRQRLLAVTLSRYQTKSYIAAGGAGGGLLAAMICNFGFLRGYIGFLLGTVFFLASIICQAIFLNHAFLAVSDDALPENEIGSFKRKVILGAERVIGLSVVLFFYCLPIVVYGYDAYSGLSAEYLFQTGFVFALAAFILYALICYFLNASLLKKGIYSLNEKEENIYHHNHVLKRKCAIGFLVIFVISVIVNGIATAGWNSSHLADGTVFNDYESFVAYMEQVIPADHYDVVWNDTEIEQAAPWEDNIIYYDENGNEITEEEALTKTLTDKDGNVLVKYLDRNENVAYIRYTVRKNECLPITVVTYDDLDEANAKMTVINVVFGIIYAIEAAGVFFIYFKKRKK